MQIFHIQKKQFFFYSIVRQKVLINLNFLHLILHSIDWYFPYIPKLLFLGSILSDTYSMKFCDAFWKMNFSIFNKGEQKKLFFTILLENQWNEIIMHLTARLLIQIPRSKSKLGVNIPLSEKTVFYLSNLRQQRLLNFGFNLNFLLRKGQFFWVAYSGSKGSDLYSTKVCKDPY